MISFKTCFFLILISLVSKLSAQDYDLLIKNGMVYDGSGSVPIKTDVGVIGDKIEAIGDLNGAKAKRVIDAKGLAVAPGFIDLHAHISDLPQMPTAESALRQGVTLLLGGPDGGGPTHFISYLDSLAQLSLGPNIGYQIGHNTIRKKVMGLENRIPSPEELEQMKSLVDEAMDYGAFGLSTGLTYLPGTFSKTDEIIELAKVASTHRGFYTSHIRDESLHLIEAVQEVITIADQADITVVLTHHKALGAPMWGASERTLQMIDSANSTGLDVRLDQYPYTASSTSLAALVPSWAKAGGTEAFKDRIANPKLRDSIKQGIIYNIIHVRVGHEIERLQFRNFPLKRELEGQTMLTWTEMEGLEPTPENAAELVIEAELNGGAQMIYHVMDEKDVDRIMIHPKTMIASDGKLSQIGVSHPHPRSYGTFPRVLGVYVRDRGLLKLEEAIKKMTSMPADLLGLKRRGSIAINYYADLVLFDPKTVKDMATFEDPHQYPAGINYVIVNGVVTIDNGQLTNNRNGRLLLKAQEK